MQLVLKLHPVNEGRHVTVEIETSLNDKDVTAVTQTLPYDVLYERVGGLFNNHLQRMVNECNAITKRLRAHAK
jgi:hypothetical protein